MFLSPIRRKITLYGIKQERANLNYFSKKFQPVFSKKEREHISLAPGKAARVMALKRGLRRLG